jgi:hypothetical protein
LLIIPLLIIFSSPTLRLPAAFLSYAALALGMVLYLIWYMAPRYGTSNLFMYIGICSLAGSLSVMSCKVSHLFAGTTTLVQWMNIKLNFTLQSAQWIPHVNHLR